MISVAEKESLEYRILYSNTERRVSNDYTVSYEKTVTPQDALKMEQYLRDKNSVRLNCKISADENKIELK